MRRDDRPREGPPERPKDRLGRLGEELAAQHLTEQGLVVLDRNWRCEAGEIDIVAREGETLVFCEVKTRTSTRFGSPLEAVTEAKASRLRRLAARWLAEHPVRPAEVRIDLVGIVRDPTLCIEHVRGAVW